MKTNKIAGHPHRKSVVAMSDDEFANFLDKCFEKGLTEKKISAIIEADCNAVCPPIAWLQ